jgi:regulator of sirC expression with transglutaminase-like and TPR domain
MISEKELEAILYLLDDSDEEIIHSLTQRLLQEGESVIPELEKHWLGNPDPLKGVRIENIIRKIQTSSLSTRFETWINSDRRDLLEACLMVSMIHYPGMEVSVVRQFIEKVRLDAWMALYNAPNPYDKIKILNHIFFERYGFKGNGENYHHIDNSFINRVIETRTGNPISLCNLYQIVANLLGIPVFGVNLPQHFVLAYCDDTFLDPIVPFQAENVIRREDYGRVLFYVNPYSKGQIFVEKNIKEFLQVIKVKGQEEFFEPCDNVEILRRMLRNIHFSYNEMKSQDQKIMTEHFMRISGMLNELDLPGGEPGDFSDDDED